MHVVCVCVHSCGKGWESFKLLVTHVVKGGHSIAPYGGRCACGMCVCVCTHVVKGRGA